MANFRATCLCLAVLIFGCVLLPAQTLPSAPFSGPPSIRPYEIPEGTTLLLRLGQRLETRTARQGQRFKAALAQNLVAPNGAVIPRGSRVRGHISRVTQGMHPRLLLSFNEIDTQNGWEPLIASVTSIPGEHVVKEDDGAIESASPRGPPSDESRSPWSRVTGVAGFFADHSVQLEKGTIIEIRLDRPLQISRR